MSSSIGNDFTSTSGRNGGRVHPLEDGKTMGWALRKRRKNTRFSEKQIRFLVDMYKEGEKMKKKKDVATVADMMQHAQGADQQKLFSPA